MGRMTHGVATKLREHPILFSADMVRAILNTKPNTWPPEAIDPSKPYKGQTRRVVKRLRGCGPVTEFQQATAQAHGCAWNCRVKGMWYGLADEDALAMCPYGTIGDTLWVRETWRAEELPSGLDGIRYRADNAFRPITNTEDASVAWCEARRDGNPWRPSLYMPRWASRVLIRIRGLRIEYLQNITDAEAIMEGILTGVTQYEGKARELFFGLWDSINGKRGYPAESNPCVWVVEFVRVDTCK